MRHVFDITDRDLEVLSAPLSFHKGDPLSDNESLVVLPSNESLSERAHSMQESTDLELCQESKERKVDVGSDKQRTETNRVIAEPNMPLGLVLKACPDILQYANDEIHHWHQLVSAVGVVSGMMGISQNTSAEAQAHMGHDIAAVTVAAILQRATDINSPGGYLRSLTRKSIESAFSPGPIVMALLQRDVD